MGCLAQVCADHSRSRLLRRFPARRRVGARNLDFGLALPSFWLSVSSCIGMDNRSSTIQHWTILCLQSPGLRAVLWRDLWFRSGEVTQISAALSHSRTDPPVPTTTYCGYSF